MNDVKLYQSSSLLEVAQPRRSYQSTPATGRYEGELTPGTPAMGRFIIGWLAGERSISAG
jgi:hypothetical protein